MIASAHLVRDTSLVLSRGMRFWYSRSAFRVISLSWRCHPCGAMTRREHACSFWEALAYVLFIPVPTRILDASRPNSCSLSPRSRSTSKSNVAILCDPIRAQNHKYYYITAPLPPPSRSSSPGNAPHLNKVHRVYVSICNQEIAIFYWKWHNWLHSVVLIFYHIRLSRLSRLSLFI